MNSVNLVGRLVAAPIPRGSGEHLAAAFTVAVKHELRGADGKYGADFIDCVSFGKLAEVLLGYLNKGDRVALTGRLSCSSYVDKDGVSRRSWSVVAESVDFCGAASAATSGAASAAASLAASAATDDDIPF